MMGRKITAPASDEHWIPLSDLMSGLMMVFMLLAVLFMLQVEEQSRDASQTAAKVTQQAKKISQQAQEITRLAAAQEELREILHRELQDTFAGDLRRWQAEIDDDLTIRFADPDVLFGSGSADVSPRFRAILDEFFPRYMRLLQDDRFRASITEIRLEGHTSSKWLGASSPTEAYLNNMALSQARTRNVLAYLLEKDWPGDTRTWLIRNLTANGLSSSKPIRNAAGAEDMALSQRVEFRVRTAGEAPAAP